MAYFAPVAPIHLLQVLCEDSYRRPHAHLLLAHHVVSHKEAFRELFQRIPIEEQRMMLIIMDNSLVELGAVVGVEMMVEALEVFKDFRGELVAVLPDVMGDSFATEEILMTQGRQWVKEISLPRGWMIVLQGKRHECLGLLETVHNVSDLWSAIRVIGLPKKLAELEGSRVPTAIALAKRPRPHRRPIHLLGFSTWQDDWVAACTPMVVGIDSAEPVRCTTRWKPWATAEKRPDDWLENAPQSPYLVDNVQKATEHFAGK